MNSDIQPYNYSQRFQESVDGTRIKARSLIYTWRVGMKQEDNIKKKCPNYRWGIREFEEGRGKTVALRTKNCNQV